MFLKKFFSVVLPLVVLSGLASANACPKWFPMPSSDLVVVIPIYDVSITGPDMDCDGLLDSVDGDIDGDGVANASDAFPLNDSEWLDTDGDGVGDNGDVFPNDASEVADTDHDGIGDNADADVDGDGTVDNGVDTDGDGINNAADTDDDGDGISDADEGVAGSDPLDANSIAFKGLAYNVIASPDTGRKWLDRNLGATKVCDKSRDESTNPFVDDAAYVADQKDCFGDYYQWGRKANGHESSDDTSEDHLDSDVESGGVFIKGNSWRNIIDDTLWYGKNAPNNVCPSGFEVPTLDDLRADTTSATGVNYVTNRDTAFANFLKLPSSGYRKYDTAEKVYLGVQGILWTSTSNIEAILFMYVKTLTLNLSSNQTFGFSIRCIKSLNIVDITNPNIIGVVTNDTVDQNITISFSEPMDISTLTSDNIWLRIQGEEDSIPATLTNTGTTVILNPNKILKYTTTYVIEVTENVKDLSGNSIHTTSINVNTHVKSYISSPFTTTDELEFDGKTYKVISSPETGAKWLDRNLGADRVCAKSRDDAVEGYNDGTYTDAEKTCFGDYYQWGRRTNGHQKLNSDENVFLLNHDVDSGGKFILVNDSPYDWRATQYKFLWTGLNRYKVCPTGFKVPRIGELRLETDHWNNRDEAFNSFFKLPVSGRRDIGGNMGDRGKWAFVWSASWNTNNTRSHTVLFGEGNSVNSDDLQRAVGAPVRCIEDSIQY